MTTAENKARKSVYGAGAINKTSKTKRARKVKQRIERAAKRGTKKTETTFDVLTHDMSDMPGITTVDSSFVTNQPLQTHLDTHAAGCGLFRDADPCKFGCTCGLYFNVRNKP